jgi:hypothetical protein
VDRKSITATRRQGQHVLRVTSDSFLKKDSQSSEEWSLSG